MPSEIGGNPVSVTTIKTTALQFLRWAYDKGVLAADAYYPGDTVGHPVFVDPVSTTAIGVLRSRQVKFVVVDATVNRISVFLRKAAPTVRELKGLPRACNGTTLQYHQGNPETVSPTAVAEASSTCAMHTGSAGGAFYTCGSSISVGNNREAGTLGCLVRDGAGAVYGLTNNHVSGACSYAPFGLPILAPGVIDITPTNPLPFTVGTHARQLPMLIGDPSSVDHTQNSDAALFKLAAIDRVSSMQRNHHDTPSSVLDMAPGMPVEKVGRTTDLKRGLVLGEIVGAAPISYSAGQYGFSGSVFLEPLYVVHGMGDVFSEGGDSGSLVTYLDAQGTRHAVGIVVAGCQDNSAPGGKRSLVLPLRPILDRLQVSLVSGHNV